MLKESGARCRQHFFWGKTSVVCVLYNCTVQCMHISTVWCLTLSFVATSVSSPTSHVCVAEGAWVRPSLSRGFGSSSRRLHRVSSLVTSGSGVSRLPRLSLPNAHPAESPTARAFYSGGSGLLRVSDSSRPSRLSLSLTNFPQQGPSLPQQVPSATRSHNPSQTTIISVCVDRLFRYSMLTLIHLHTLTCSRFTSMEWSQPQQLEFWLSPPAGGAI